MVDINVFELPFRIHLKKNKLLVTEKSTERSLEDRISRLLWGVRKLDTKDQKAVVIEEISVKTGIYCYNFLGEGFVLSKTFFISKSPVIHYFTISRNK